MFVFRHANHTRVLFPCENGLFLVIESEPFHKRLEIEGLRFQQAKKKVFSNPLFVR